MAPARPPPPPPNLTRRRRRRRTRRRLHLKPRAEDGPRDQTRRRRDARPGPNHPAASSGSAAGRGASAEALSRVAIPQLAAPPRAKSNPAPTCGSSRTMLNRIPSPENDGASANGSLEGPSKIDGPMERRTRADHVQDLLTRHAERDVVEGQDERSKTRERSDMGRHQADPVRGHVHLQDAAETARIGRSRPTRAAPRPRRRAAPAAPARGDLRRPWSSGPAPP